ncbi:hypothetical protein N7539_008932 [Penicillium diatomitis]|uniref:Uncharacterized protein n=1 Tax=Penicillium diatomitis TaxID=2819901 RepID=A0A9X0BJC3_9EURO|nr:uncharacterized protein N7539_008932 [Penicillium diatomitis]KAJ5469314.1 hypothetical protein N7539_008932 [Penicillium diatomitis]
MRSAPGGVRLERQGVLEVWGIEYADAAVQYMSAPIFSYNACPSGGCDADRPAVPRSDLMGCCQIAPPAWRNASDLLRRAKTRREREENKMPAALRNPTFRRHLIRTRAVSPAHIQRHAPDDSVLADLILIHTVWKTRNLLSAGGLLPRFEASQRPLSSDENSCAYDYEAAPQAATYNFVQILYGHYALIAVTASAMCNVHQLHTHALGQLGNDASDEAGAS